METTGEATILESGEKVRTLLTAIVGGEDPPRHLKTKLEPKMGPTVPGEDVELGSYDFVTYPNYDVSFHGAKTYKGSAKKPSGRWTLNTKDLRRTHS